MAAPSLRAAWSRLAPGERLAALAALLPAALLWAPWTQVTSEPLCIFPPCAEPQTYWRPAFDAPTALLLAAAGLVAAAILVLVRDPALRRLGAAIPVLVGGIAAVAAPDWPSIHIFEHLSGLGWGLAADEAAATAVLAGIATAGLGRRPAAAETAADG